MREYIWQKSKRLINSKELFNNVHKVFYVPDSIVEKLCRTSDFEKDPVKFDGEKVKIKMVTDNITEHESTGFVIEEGAEFIIPLYFSYLRAIHCSNEPIIIIYKSVSLKEGKFAFVYGTEQSTNNFNTWINKFNYFAVNEIEPELETRQIERYYINFDAEIDDVVYVGETLDIKISEDMSIAKFKDEVKRVIGVIPTIYYNQKEVKNDIRLKSIGFKGQNVVRIDPNLAVGDVNCILKKLFNKKRVEIYFKYIQRPWSYMGGSVLLSDVDFLPSIMESIKCNLLVWFVNLRCLQKFLDE